MSITGPLTPWLLTAALLLGSAIGSALDPLRDWLLESYDDAHPVIVTQSRIVSRDPGRIVVAVRGEKLRNCHFIPPAVGDGIVPGEPERDLRITRLDKPISGVNRRIGPIAEQTWELLDIEGLSKAIIFVSYDCGGRYVTNKFVEVAL